jgi:peptidoglycan hydrolase CwlO-like protein
MISSEVQSELSKKVDDWRFSSVESKVNRLENKVRQNEQEITQLQNTISNVRYAFQQLCDLFDEKQLMPEESNRLTYIKSIL